MLNMHNIQQAELGNDQTVGIVDQSLEQIEVEILNILQESVTIVQEVFV